VSLETIPPTHGHRRRPVATYGAVVLVAALAVIGAGFGIVAIARGTDVPYSDPAVSGALTLCSAKGKAVTEGSTKKPLAAVVLGESELPAQYAVEGAVGSLFAYQPRDGVDAQEFGGLQLTGSSVLADPAEQTGVRVTKDATTVGQFVVAFPANLDGFVQLRLYVSAPGAGTLSSQYDAADLQVDGDHWELVQGGSADCSKASSALAPSSQS